MTLLDICATAGLAAALIALVLIDLREFRLPDRITLPLIAAGLLVNALTVRDWPVSGLVGALVGYATFWLIGEVFFRLRGKDGLGLGDAKLLAAAGAWMGPAPLAWVVLIAALGALGAVWVTGRGRTGPIAFGPWLALGFWVMWIFSLATRQV